MDGRKHSVIEAGGKRYNLRVSFSAISRFEKDIGAFQILNGKDAKTFYGFQGLVWASINACGGEITFDETAELCECYCEENGYPAFVKKMQTLIDENTWLSRKGADTKNQMEKPKEVSAK